jgi:WD40 repeat protein
VLGKPWRLYSPAPPEPSDLAVSPDGTYAYAPLSPVDGTVATFDLRSYSGLEETASGRPNLGCSSCDLRSAAITPDGSRVLIGGDIDGVLDTATGHLSRVTTPESGTSDVAITPDGASAYAVGARDALWRYIMPAGTFDGSILAPDHFGTAVAVSPAGDRLYLAGGTSGDYKLYVLDELTHAPIGTAVAMPDTPIAMNFIPDQAPVASVTSMGSARYDGSASSAQRPSGSPCGSTAGPLAAR